MKQKKSAKNAKESEQPSEQLTAEESDELDESALDAVSGGAQKGNELSEEILR